ncbi:hypothetical protein F4778DRAFT_775844 [Xylariomycetidae sp. FL2044]|nr:hypothetical protein F4778DRAFT_775844 [Xylariomycetidae sp. FL2044]
MSAQECNRPRPCKVSALPTPAGSPNALVYKTKKTLIGPTAGTGKALPGESASGSSSSSSSSSSSRSDPGLPISDRTRAASTCSKVPRRVLTSTLKPKPLPLSLPSSPQSLPVALPPTATSPASLASATSAMNMARLMQELPRRTKTNGSGNSNGRNNKINGNNTTSKNNNNKNSSYFASRNATAAVNVEQRVQELEINLEQARNANEVLKEQVAELQTRLDDLQARFDKLQGRVEALNVERLNEMIMRPIGGPEDMGW